MKIYTKQGDKGSTAVFTSTVTRIDKDDILLDCYGTLDELNSYLGLCIANMDGVKLKAEQEDLLNCQKQIFSIGFALSDSDKLQASSVEGLEVSIDRLEALLSPQTSFILPGGSGISAHLHVARTIARRAERQLVNASKHYDVSTIALAYINRLSDYLFVVARYCNAVVGMKDIKV